MRELAEIGLPAHWIKAAKIVGYDAFVTMWRMLSDNPALRDDSNQVAVTIRPIRSYDRYQRNRYVDTLAAAGLTNRQIMDAVRHQIGEPLTLRQVHRLTSKARRNGEAQALAHQCEDLAAGTVTP